jgi:hypothetical protein
MFGLYAVFGNVWSALNKNLSKKEEEEKKKSSKMMHFAIYYWVSFFNTHKMLKNTQMKKK